MDDFLSLLLFLGRAGLLAFSFQLIREEQKQKRNAGKKALAAIKLSLQMSEWNLALTLSVGTCPPHISLALPHPQGRLGCQAL